MAPPVGSSDTGLYVHFPYCEKKCSYCDFNSHAVSFDGTAYADAVLRELELRGPEHHPVGGFRSIYFGGGTPSLWDPREVGRVLRAVESSFGVSEGVEVTLEANPGTVHEALFAAFVNEGINRFSIGTQSFIEQELVSLGRIHDAGAGERAVSAAKKTGARVSLDLIYAQPGQSFEDVRRSLRRALSLEPDHISAYTLTVEPDTVLGRQFAAGRFTPMDDDAQADLIELVTETFGEAGYARYEVSSYAKEGAEAIHNSLYWTGGAYLGLGAGAHSYRPDQPLRGGKRRSNAKSPQLYMDGTQQGCPPAFEETPSMLDTLGDRLMMGLRTRWGVDLRRLDQEAALGGSLVEALSPVAERLEVDGLILRQGEVLIPSARGFFFSDLLAREFSKALEHATSLDTTDPGNAR